MERPASHATPPILNIYRKYYGRRVSLYLLATFYATMVVAGLVVETVFELLGLVPEERNAKVLEASVTWNYTTYLNIAFLVLSDVLVARFLKTGGPGMLRMMARPPEEAAAREVEATHAHHEGDGSYVCPMHPEVVSSDPGRLPRCGMELERVED